MKKSKPVKIDITVRQQTPEEEQAFWSAMDRFIEAFVRDQIKRMRSTPTAAETPSETAVSTTSTEVTPAAS